MATPRRPNRPEPQFQVEDLVTSRRAKFLLWLNTAVKLSVLTSDREAEALVASIGSAISSRGTTSSVAPCSRSTRASCCRSSDDAHVAEAFAAATPAP
jgi:hypothetical protein